MNIIAKLWTGFMLLLAVLFYPVAYILFKRLGGKE